MILERSAPGVQHPGEPRKVGAEEALVGGQPLERRGRRLQHRLGREALMGADEGSERLRDGEGAEAVRLGQQWLQVMREPLLGCMLLTRGTVAVATGLMEAGLSCTMGARRETRAIGAAAAVLDGADHLTGCGGEGRRALQGLGGKGGADLAEGGQGKSPCLRAFRRS